MAKAKDKKLVIVESPAKAKTIEKILGKDYQVIASFGHIRDLPKSKLGVDVENNFTPSYSTIKGKGEIIKKLKDMAKKSDKIYLASDPDREGEAIAWHIAEALKLDKEENNRIEFNEITANAVKDSIKNSRKIDINKVNAQQTRRILDRLVGYEISSLLWKSIASNTSAGRVQSVALKLICDLEDKIRKFVPEKFWDIKGKFEGELLLNLYKVAGEKIDKVTDEKIVKEIEKLEKEKFEVTQAKITKKSKKPPLPLKTSTLQQLASSYLGFSASRTMRIAQGLYEGVEVNGVHKGLITYMRTDSTRISKEAKEMAKEYILENFGKEYLGIEKESTSKQKIQDAHEGIRPTDIKYTPEMLVNVLDKDQYKLYKLIWERFLISQLAPMKYEQFELILSYEKFDFRGTINKIIFDGYYKIFKDEDELALGDFPAIEIGDKKSLEKLTIKEDFTKPPARFTESSLVKKLEAEGIGRPSTYATIIETLKKREYVVLEGKSFVPTELGVEIKKSLDENFPNIMNIKFTAGLENQLDEIAEGDEDWVKVLSDFYGELKIYIEKYKIKVEDETNRVVESDVDCPCGAGKMKMKNGRFGKYLVCPKDDDTKCDNTISLKGIKIPIEDIKNGKITVKNEVETATKNKVGIPTDYFAENGARYILKNGRFGSYLESENYKEDNLRFSLPSEIKKMLNDGKIVDKNGVLEIKKEIDSIKNEENKILSSAGVCEKCGKPFVLRKGRWGRFLACTGYPQCKNIKKIENN